MALSLLYGPTLTTIHDYWKNHSLTIWTFVGKVMSLLLNTLSRFVMAFLPRGRRLLISLLKSPSSVILESKKIKSVSPVPCMFWQLYGGVNGNLLKEGLGHTYDQHRHHIKKQRY